MTLSYLGQSYTVPQVEIGNLETVERSGLYRGVAYRFTQKSAQRRETARLRYRGVDYQR